MVQPCLTALPESGCDTLRMYVRVAMCSPMHSAPTCQQCLSCSDCTVLVTLSLSQNCECYIILTSCWKLLCNLPFIPFLPLPVLIGFVGALSKIWYTNSV